MSSERVDAQRFMCDGCGRMFLVDVELDGPPDGYHGEVSRVDVSGAWGGSWFACSRKCIRSAVLTAVDRDG